MSTNAILTRSLSRSFGAVQALSQVSFEVPQSIVFGYLGPNGSGKTTTIRLLLGLLEPDAGEAEVLGYNTRTQAQEIRENCGALLEHTGLYERMSAMENLDFYARVWHLPAAERAQRIQSLLGDLGLWERRDEKVGGWSRGMKQKLAVARALLHRPRLLFLDEPTAGLDPVAAAALREDLAALVEQQGVTVFLTTHNLSEAERLCARVAVIDRGRLLAVGSPDELRSRQGGQRLEIHGRGINDEVIDSLRQRPEVARAARENQHLLVDLNENSESAAIVSYLVQAGVEIEEVRKGKASLEEAFLTLLEDEK
ncbi:ABC transporter [Ornatilinea apprima]|uniref:ABC transporter n=1 Tax=Ornatilinea apprima TaxID=1134406 RepID=A0A0P6XCG4_9CHLR|nr:ABC transporter ATP-binding protein [Ornatilinea apprima]KPL80124.1 ABC transporter [Ornatilinea apprima]